MVLNPRYLSSCQRAQGIHAEYGGASKAELVTQYVANLPPSRPLSQYLMAEVLHLLLAGEECPLLYDGDANVWYFHDSTSWRSGPRDNLQRAKSLVQHRSLDVLRTICDGVKNMPEFPPRPDGAPNARVGFLDKFLQTFEKSEQLQAVVRESPPLLAGSQDV